MENLHPTEIRVLEVVRDGKDWRSMNPARKALLKRFPGYVEGSRVPRPYPEAFKDRDDVVGEVLRKVWRSNDEHSWITKKPTFYTEREPVQRLFAKEAERRAREREEQRAAVLKEKEEEDRRAEQLGKEWETNWKAQQCWIKLKYDQGYSVPDIRAFKVLYKLSVVEGKVRPEFYDCDRKEMVWFNEE